MGSTLDAVIAKLPPLRRKAVEQGAAELIRQELSLRELRKAFAFTQVRLAEALNTSQNHISKLEQRSDLLLSTLRSYVEAMGGTLRLIAEFPGGPSIAISGFSDLDAQASEGVNGPKIAELSPQP
jgi:transcriptional regulator with XRE-family HTH domain